MSANESTVIALKSSFLRTQIRILSQPLQPSQRWRDNSRHSGILTDSAIADATREINRQLRRHTKAAYSSLAVRHVAEQIDRLYWDNARPDLELDDLEEPDDGVLRVGDDFTTSETIDKLTDTWDFDTEAPISAKQRADRDAYEESCNKLKELAERREAALKKLLALKQLKTMLEPFEMPQGNVQPNLVTRDGRLAEELSKCRELSVRVGARMGAVADRDDDDGETMDLSWHDRQQKAWCAT